jgi:hypothetical protein
MDKVKLNKLLEDLRKILPYFAVGYDNKGQMILYTDIYPEREPND